MSAYIIRCIETKNIWFYPRNEDILLRKNPCKRSCTKLSKALTAAASLSYVLLTLFLSLLALTPLVTMSPYLLQKTQRPGFATSPFVVVLAVDDIVKGSRRSRPCSFATSCLTKQARVFVAAVEELQQQGQTT